METSPTFAKRKFSENAEARSISSNQSTNRKETKFKHSGEVGRGRTTQVSGAGRVVVKGTKEEGLKLLNLSEKKTNVRGEKGRGKKPTRGCARGTTKKKAKYKWSWREIQPQRVQAGGRNGRRGGARISSKGDRYE